MRTVLPLLLLSTACRTGGKVGDAEPQLDSGGLAAVDADGDGFAADEDCDDEDASVNDGATEVCDGIDNDCDGEIDEGVTGTWYTDADGDTYGDPSDPVEGCTQPAGTVSSANDCDDDDPDINPVAAERCDGVDNDCDGEIDEDVQGTWYADADGDGFGDPDAVLENCDPPSGYVDDASDCDDAAAAVNPDATEVCNRIDDDCDGTIDEPDAVGTSTWYADNDGDGYGDPDRPTEDCQQPPGTVADDSDCDDVAFDVNPGATEVCNGIDDDCDNLVDDDDSSLDGSAGGTWYADSDMDGYGDPGAPVDACTQPPGTVTDSSDCDDGDGNVNPGETEICNGIDDDCDTLVDDDDSSLDASTRSTWYADADSDGYGDAASPTDACTQPTGAVADSSDCDDGNGDVNPGETEICNGIDDDCDNLVDDDDSSLDTSSGTTWYADADGDGYGDATAGTSACVQPSGTVADDSDCDDTSAAAYPDALERLTGSDTDCDGTVDEAAVAVVFGYQCLAESGSDDYSSAQLTGFEEDALTDHLLDLALGLDRYDEPSSGWGSTSLADYNLILMTKCGWGWQSTNQALVDEMLDQRDAGAATFVFGDDMAWRAGVVSDYEELILMDAASDNGSPGPVTVTPASSGTHPILTGSYGTVSSFSYDRDIDITTTWGNGEAVLATRGSSSRPVWVAYEDTASGARQASYLGNIDTCNHVILSSSARAESEELFQNTVEWLLEL